MYLPLSTTSTGYREDDPRAGDDRPTIEDRARVASRESRSRKEGAHERRYEPYASSSGAAQRWPQRDDRVARALNAHIVADFNAGRCAVMSVLNATALSIKRCGADVLAAEACVQELARTATRSGRGAVRPGVVVFNALISAYGKAKDAKGARSVCNRMRAAGLAPNIVTYSTLISACGRAGELEGAREWFHEMEAEGIEPNVITFSALMSAYERAGDAAGVNRCVERMRSRRIKPDISIYSALISVCGKGQDLAGARRWFLRMREDGIEPDVVAYGALISAYANAMDVRGAGHQFRLMEEEGIAADAVTYGALISAYHKVGDTLGASARFLDMLKQGIRPSSQVCTMMISCFEKAGQREDAAVHLDNAVRLGVFGSSLGFDRRNNTLDLHDRAVIPSLGRSSKAICPEVAKVIFRTLFERGDLNRGTHFIVGKGGEDRVKEAIRDCMAEVGWTARHPLDASGVPNEGRWATVPEDIAHGGAHQPKAASRKLSRASS